MIYMFLASGFEETEALVPLDLLRRAELDVVTVGIGSPIIKGSHGIAVVTDIDENEMVLEDSTDMIILPGGMPGTLNLESSATVQKAIDYCVENDKYIAAICAAPSILGRKNLLNGKKAVCFPGYENQLFGADISDEFICHDGRIITAKGAGVALEFGLKLVEILISKERSNLLEASLQCRK